MALSGALCRTKRSRLCGDDASSGFGRRLRAVGARLGDSINEMIRHSTPIQTLSSTEGLPELSAHAYHFLQRTQLVIGFRPKEDWPIGIGHFGDVDVAARIQRDAVRDDELAQPLADRLSAKMGQGFPLRGDDGEPRPEIGHALGQRGHCLWAEFADHRNRLLAPRDEEAAGAHEIVPLRLIFAVAVEDLHAMIFAIGDIDPALVVAGDIMDEIEVFEQLEALGWVTRTPGPRQGSHWIVNPEVHVRFAERAAKEAAQRRAARELIASQMRAAARGS
jgi:hypothetical protein